MGTAPLHPHSDGRSSSAFSRDEKVSHQSGDLSTGYCFSVKEPGSNTPAAGMLLLTLHVNLIISSGVYCISLVNGEFNLPSSSPNLSILYGLC